MGFFFIKRNLVFYGLWYKFKIHFYEKKWDYWLHHEDSEGLPLGMLWWSFLRGVYVGEWRKKNPERLVVPSIQLLFLWALVIFSFFLPLQFLEGSMASTAPTLRALHHLIGFPKPHPRLANSPFLGWLHRTVACVVTQGLCLELYIWFNTFETLNTLTRAPHFHFVPGPLNYVAAPGPFIKLSSSVRSIPCQELDL